MVIRNRCKVISVMNSFENIRNRRAIKHNHITYILALCINCVELLGGW